MLLQDAVYRWTLGLLAVVTVGLLCGGCAGRTSMIPNSDKELRKPSVAFAADAAKRSYPAAAPRGGDAQAQASVDHGLFNRIEVSNLSDGPWTNVEFWVNDKYVVFVPNWQPKEMKHIDFPMLYDRDGGSFPVDNKSIRVEKIEILRDGKLYGVPAKLAD
jgi:hypothetical protein